MTSFNLRKNVAQLLNYYIQVTLLVFFLKVKYSVNKELQTTRMVFQLTSDALLKTHTEEASKGKGHLLVSQIYIDFNMHKKII